MSSPAIRFAGFTEDWEQRKLGGLGRVSTGNTPPTSENDNWSDSADGHVWITPTDINACLMSNSVRHLTDIGWTIARVVPAFSVLITSIASIGKNAVNTIPVAFNQQINAIVPEGNDAYFILSAMEKCKERFAGTAGQTATAIINKTEFEKFSLSIPSVQEQQQVGGFFFSLDRLITLHQREHDKTVNIKKALLEKMFPKDGEDKPEIRFAGFTGAWEQRKLGELALSFEYGLNAAATTFDGIHKYIRITDIDDETHEFKFDSLTTPDVNLRLADSYLLKDGDVLFARTGASVGKTYQYKEHDGLVYFAGFLIRARINQKYDSEFVFQNTLTRKYNSFIATTSQRSGQPGVNAVEYADYEILVPKLDEQKAIGIFLSKLDRLIALHKRELTKLQNIKKALLEKMFV